MADISSHFQEAIEFIGGWRVCMWSALNLCSKVLCRDSFFYVILSSKTADSQSLILKIALLLNTSRQHRRFKSS